MKRHEMARRILAVNLEELKNEVRNTRPETLANVQESIDLLTVAADCAVEIIRWQAVGFPDDGETVLIRYHAMGDESFPITEVGFRDAGRWRFANAEFVYSDVLAWASFPGKEGL